jgi:hypothetical protein
MSFDAHDRYSIMMDYKIRRHCLESRPTNKNPTTIEKLPAEILRQILPKLTPSSKIMALTNKRMAEFMIETPDTLSYDLWYLSTHKRQSILAEEVITCWHLGSGSPSPA